MSETPAASAEPPEERLAERLAASPKPEADRRSPPRSTSSRTWTEPCTGRSRAPRRRRSTNRCVACPGLANNSVLWLAIAGGIFVVGGKRGRRAALTGVAAIGLNSAVVNLPMKTASRRRRPDREIAGVPEARWVTMPTSTSFPSGHSASAFAFAGAVAGELPVLAVPLRALAAGVAYSRVHTGVHYPGDVIVRARCRGDDRGGRGPYLSSRTPAPRPRDAPAEPPTRLERCCLGGMPLGSGRHGGGRGGTAGGLPTVGAGHPDAPDLSAFVAPLRPRGRRRAGRDPRAAGHGLCGTRGSARRDRPLHDDRLSHRLRPLRALEDPRARPGLFGRAVDLRGDRRRCS